MTLTGSAVQEEASTNKEGKAMSNQVASGGHWRIIGWGLAAALLAAPFVAMQFTSEVQWDAADFIFAGVMFGTIGLLFELTVRLSPNGFHRGGVAAALSASFLIVWANAAVGMIGSGDNVFTLLFLGVILIALGGSILSRFRSGGMAATMLAAGVAHAGVAIAALPVDQRGALFSLFLALPWLASAALFRESARHRRSGA